MLVAIGKVTVAMAGTPVSLLSRLTSPQAAKIQALQAAGLAPIHGVSLQTVSTNSGKVWIGDQDLNKASGLGVGHVLPPPTATFFASFSVALSSAPNAVSLAGIYLDVDTGGEGVYVFVLVH
jgi:hypothetical protein